MSESDNASFFSLDRLRELVQLMEEHELHELDLSEADRRLRLRRGAPAAPPPVAAAPTREAASASAQAGASEEAPPDDPHIVTVKSPMVGTFYSRPNPNAEAFVKRGDAIEPETTVCIIEAMKVFNEIPAEVRGKIVAVLVDDEEAVEFGTPLFKVDTSA